MPTPAPIKAVIAEVRPITGKLAWEVSLMPDCTTWLTVHSSDLGGFGAAPHPGDTLEIVPPHVIGIERTSEC